MELGEERKRRFGAAMHAARSAARMSQTDLADALKSTQANISNYERGRNAPDPATCFAIEEALGLPAGSLSHHLGYIPARVETVPCTIARAVAEDERLDDIKRDALLTMYRALTGN